VKGHGAGFKLLADARFAQRSGAKAEQLTHIVRVSGGILFLNFVCHFECFQ
jgi:hypothetical protein